MSPEQKFKNNFLIAIGWKTVRFEIMFRPVYIEHQCQCCVNSAMIIGILFLTEYNGVTRKWVATPFWSDCIVFNERDIASVIAELLQL